MVVVRSLTPERLPNPKPRRRRLRIAPVAVHEDHEDPAAMTPYFCEVCQLSFTSRFSDVATCSQCQGFWFPLTPDGQDSVIELESLFSSLLLHQRREVLMQLGP